MRVESLLTVLEQGYVTLIDNETNEVVYDELNEKDYPDIETLFDKQIISISAGTHVLDIYI